MLFPVEFANFEHRVRVLSVNYGEQDFNAVTLGPGSYLVSGSFEFGSIDCQVLIGRYSSLGHRIIVNVNGNYSPVV